MLMMKPGRVTSETKFPTCRGTMVEQANTPPEEQKDKDYSWKLKKEAQFWGEMARVRAKGGIPMTMDFSRATRYRVRRSSLGWGDYFQDPRLEALTPFGRARKRFVEKARNSAGKRTLDLCCGAGWLALEQARAGKVVDAVDISEEEQSVAKEYQATLEEEIPGRINWIATDLNRYTTEPEQYDQVTAWDGLHHIENFEHLCDQIANGLRPGGYFLLSERVWGGDSPSVRARVGKYLELFLWALVPTPAPYTYGRKFRELYGTLKLFFRTKILRKKHVPKAWQITDEGFCSPFEDISGSEILKIVNNRFDVEESEGYGGFTEEVLRSLYLPRLLRVPAILFLGWLDHLLVRVGLLEGKIAILYARKRSEK